MIFYNPGILATFICLCMLFLQLIWPKMLLDTFEDVGKMTIPLSMILIGSLLADLRMKDLRQYSKNIYIWIALFCKLLFLPLSLLVFLFLHVPYPLIIIAILTAAMPSASSSSVYMLMFGSDF